MPHVTGRRTTRKQPSAAQKRARADFKKKIEKAKKIQKENPKLTWQQAIKKAF
jgi:hypothetical protein